MHVVSVYYMKLVLTVNTVYQLLFTSTIFGDLLEINWFATANFRVQILATCVCYL